MTRKILILTGDHGAPDPTKRGGQYNEEDAVTHAAMSEAFRSMPGLEVDVVAEHDGLFER